MDLHHLHLPVTAASHGCHHIAIAPPHHHPRQPPHMVRWGVTNTEGTVEAIEGDDDKVTSNENAKDLVELQHLRESVEPEPSTEPSIETSVMTSKPAEASQATTDSLPNGNLEANLVTDIGSDALSIKEVDPAPSKKKSEPPSSTTDKSEAVEETGSKTIVGGSLPE
ncbi:hypothetical protein Tco_1328508 [Tanacetum coccineum]